MQPSGERVYESPFRGEFKAAFLDLMKTVDLRTWDIGSGELDRMKGMVSELHQSTERRSKESGTVKGRKEIVFASGVGQVTLPKRDGIDVYVKGCSPGYVDGAEMLSLSSGGITKRSLTNRAFIKREIEDAAGRSDTYKTLKMRLQGLSYIGEDGSFGKIKTVDLAVSARAYNLFFLGIVNSVEYVRNAMSVYVISGIPAKAPVEKVTPDHVGFDAIRRAYVARTALNCEVARGEKYDPRILKKW